MRKINFIKGGTNMVKRPRWEIKYELYKTEGEKFEKIKAEIEELKNATVTARTIEEFENAKIKQKKEIMNKMNQVKEYNIFKKFESKIDNILEYRKDLEKRLDSLPRDTRQELENKNKEKEALMQTVTLYQKEIENMEKMLKQQQSDEYKKLVAFALKDRKETMEKIQERQLELDNEISELQEAGKNFNETAENQKIMLERKIAKCNIIAANLLKGKDIGEFSLNVNDGKQKYTAQNNNMKKEIEASKYPNAKITEQADNNLNVREAKPTSMQNSQANAIAKVEDFSQKHPKLAKVMNFFKDLKNKLVSKISTKGLKDEEVEAEVKNTVKEEMDDDFYKKYDKVFEGRKTKQQTLEKQQPQEQNNFESEEDKLLWEITEKGKNKTFRDRLKTSRTVSANNYAEKFGGIYEKQDGATYKKHEEQPEQEPQQLER